MKALISFTVIDLALATAFTASSASANVILPNSSASSLPYSDIDSGPPLPGPGESVGQWIDQIFGNPDNSSNSASDSTSDFLGYHSFNDSTIRVNNLSATEVGSKKSKRTYQEEYGLHELTWTNETAKVGYNISVDLSNCSTGLRLPTVVGVYTFSNGTTNNETTLRAMITDLWSLRHSRSSPSNPYTNQIEKVAQLALDEANEVLSSGLICQNAIATTGSPGDTTGMVVHNELRRLLTNAYSAWTTILLGTVAGGVCGATIASLGDYVFNGNVTAENVAQSATLVALIVLITGILNRQYEIGRLDRVENPLGAAQAAAAHAIQRIPVNREVVVPNVFIAFGRRAIQLIKRLRRINRALSQHGIEVQGSGLEAVEEALTDHGISVRGSGISGVEEALTEHGISVEGSGDSGYQSALEDPSLSSGTGSEGFGSVPSDIESCITPTEAAEAAEAIAQISDPDLALQTMQEVVQEVAGRNEDGSCGV